MSERPAERLKELWEDKREEEDYNDPLAAERSHKQLRSVWQTSRYAIIHHTGAPNTHHAVCCSEETLRRNNSQMSSVVM